MLLGRYISIGKLFSQNLHDKIRDKFHYVDESPYAGRRIFLDSVSGALRLKDMGERACKEVKSYAQKNRVDPASVHFAEIKRKFKSDARLFFGTDSGNIVPAMSGTHAIYRCVNAVCAAAKAGNNIVTTGLEHPAAYEATHQFAQKYDLERRVADFDPESGFVPADNILEHVDQDTELLMIIHGSNVTGAVNNIKEIVARARKKNPDIYAVVDGVQYAPHGLINVEELGVDAYAISGYKIFCKKGSGIAWINERFDRLPHWQFRERPEGEWAIGAEDESTYAGFSAVINYLKWLGEKFVSSDDERDRVSAAMEKISSHTEALMATALEGSEGQKGLRKMRNVKIFGLKGRPENRTGLISFKIEGEDSLEAARKYFDKFGISLSTREMNIYARHILERLGVNNLIRASFCHYNCQREIKEFIDATNKLQS